MRLTEMTPRRKDVGHMRVEVAHDVVRRMRGKLKARVGSRGFNPYRPLYTRRENFVEKIIKRYVRIKITILVNFFFLLTYGAQTTLT